MTVFKTKAEKSNILLVNMMMISIFYLIYLILGDYVLLGVLKIVYEVLDVYDVDTNFLEFRSD